MRSTYDRIGGNEFADASHFLFMNEEDYNVTLDLKGKWQSAGIWYLAGSNSCMASRPDGELDVHILRVQTSNRRLRDEEFMIPAQLIFQNSQISMNHFIAEPPQTSL
jgi:hypothetical protein